VLDTALLGPETSLAEARNRSLGYLVQQL
jgi:hypothetical protein